MNIWKSGVFKYLHSDMIGNSKWLLTIRGVVEEELESDRGKETKPVLYFTTSEKGMVLNKTNIREIVKITGTPETEQWAGQKVTVYAKEIKAFGKKVNALRIGPPTVTRNPREKGSPAAQLDNEQPPPDDQAGS